MVKGQDDLMEDTRSLLQTNAGVFPSEGRLQKWGNIPKNDVVGTEVQMSCFHTISTHVFGDAQSSVGQTRDLFKELVLLCSKEYKPPQKSYHDRFP